MLRRIVWTCVCVLSGVEKVTVCVFVAQGGWTALHFACISGDTAKVEMLLKSGANVNRKYRKTTVRGGGRGEGDHLVEDCLSSQ